MIAESVMQQRIRERVIGLDEDESMRSFARTVPVSRARRTIESGTAYPKRVNAGRRRAAGHEEWHELYRDPHDDNDHRPALTAAMPK